MERKLEWQVVTQLRLVEVDGNGKALLLRQETVKQVVHRETLREGDKTFERHTDDPTQLAVHAEAYTRCLAVATDLLAEIESLDESDVDDLVRDGRTHTVRDPQAEL